MEGVSRRSRGVGVCSGAFCAARTCTQPPGCTTPVAGVTFTAESAAEGPAVKDTVELSSRLKIWNTATCGEQSRSGSTPEGEQLQHHMRNRVIP